MPKAYKVFLNHRKEWTKEEDAYVLLQRKHGRKWSEIAKVLERTPMSIRGRFKQLDKQEKERNYAATYGSEKP